MKYIYLILFAIANIVLSGVLVRFSQTGAVATGAYRLLLTIPLLLISFKPNDFYQFKQLTKTDLLIPSLAGIFFALDLAFYNASLIDTTIAEATLLTNLVPFITVPIAIFIFKEKIPLRFIYPSILMLAGLYLLMKNASLNATHLEGNIMALISAIFYALFLSTMKVSRDNLNARSGMLIVCLVGGIILLAIAYLKKETILPVSWYGISILFLIAFCGQLLGQTLLAYAIKFVPLSTSSLLMVSSPIIGAIYALIFFGEGLNLIQILGMLIVLSAVYLGKLILTPRK